jgi:hypothetical protein
MIARGGAMKGEIDPRLLAQVEQAGDQGEVEAVLMLRDQGQTTGDSAEDSLGHQIVDRVSKHTEQTPTSVRFMPKLGVLYVKGSGKLIRQLLEQNEVVSATANEPDITFPEGTQKKD